MKILLLDDEFYILDGLMHLVRENFPNSTVYSSDSVEDALKILAEITIDIMVSDIRVGQSNALEMIEQIRCKHPDMHIFIISGYGEFDYAKKAIDLGIKNYIVKPIQQDAFIKLITVSVNEIIAVKKKKESIAAYERTLRKKIIRDLISGEKQNFETVFLKTAESYRAVVMQFLKKSNFQKAADALKATIQDMSKNYNEEKNAIFFCMELYDEVAEEIRQQTPEKFLTEMEFEIINPDTLECVGKMFPYFENLEKKLLFMQEYINRAKNEKILGAILEYITLNYKIATLESAAAAVELSPIYVSNIFKLMYGENFRDVLIKFKLSRAKELLQNTTLRITEISSLVGYTDSKYFSKNFCKHFGCTPQEYRRNNP